MNKIALADYGWRRKGAIARKSRYDAACGTHSKQGKCAASGVPIRLGNPLNLTINPAARVHDK